MEARSNEVAKNLEQGPFSKMLKLNVGGQLFLTSLETLKKDPGNFKTYVPSNPGLGCLRLTNFLIR